MDDKEFSVIVDGCIVNIKNVLDKKANEYSNKNDKLHNFNKAKELMRCNTREYALLGMLNKHLVSVIDMIMKHEKEGELPEEKILNEKIGDSINYFILLKACFMDDITSANKNRCSNIPTIPKQTGPAWDPYRNSRKAAVVKATRKKVQPILEYLEYRDDKYTIAQIEDIFAHEQQKTDDVPDDNFYICIIKFLKGLNLSNDRTCLPKDAITIDEKRNSIVKELEESL